MNYESEGMGKEVVTAFVEFSKNNPALTCNVMTVYMACTMLKFFQEFIQICLGLFSVFTC